MVKNMIRKIIIFYLSIYCLSAFAFAGNLVFHYEPAVVSLTGIIKIKTFPGAPNYESIAKGDDIESGPYLLLSNPIDVIKTAKDADPNAETEKNLKIIQIVVDDDIWREKYIGKMVRVTGTLYHQINGHHHTRILINATRLELASK